MSDSNDTAESKRSGPSFKQPEFCTQVPEELLNEWHTLPTALQYVIKQQSIQGQQNEWIMQRLGEGHERIAFIERQVDGFDKLRIIISSKWSLLASFGTLLVVPVLLMWLGAFVSKLMGKH